MNENEIREYVQTPEGQRLIQPITDRRVSEALRTYRENHPIPDLSEFETKIADKDAEISRLKIENHLIEQCHERNIPVNFVRELGLRFDDISEIDSRLELLSARIGEMTTNAVNAKLVQGFVPGGSLGTERPDIRTMSAERVAFLDELGELDKMITP